MLKADDLPAEHFMRLWHEEMWKATGLADRARLVLELGRLEVLTAGQAAPMLVSYVATAEPPVVVLPLPDTPGPRAPALRQKVAEGLREMGASEVYLVVSLAAGQRHGMPHFALTAWGESAGGEEAVWVLPFRQTPAGLQEAEPLLAPDPRATVLSRELQGLLRRLH
jgi:hypothetical protein